MAIGHRLCDPPADETYYLVVRSSGYVRRALMQPVCDLTRREGQENFDSTLRQVQGQGNSLFEAR